MDTPIKQSVACWCGNQELNPFSKDYLHCARCQTLVLRQVPGPDVTRVQNEQTDLYGKNYYARHLPQDFGYPNFASRARADLPERCLHWLRTVLKYKVPPGKALELGSAHGGFVSMLRWTGFDAVGLELSPWVVEFAKRTFDVPMLSGPIEDQNIPSGSLDVIALMDVLEHLPSPLQTIERCLHLLKEDGVLVIQTPRYPENRTHKQMIAQQDRFLEQLKSGEHIYLYSQASAQEFLRRLGITSVAFEPAIFAHYDMSIVASKSPLSISSPEQIETALSATTAGRLIQSLLDADNHSHDLRERLQGAEADRAARLDVIQQQGQRAAELEAEVHRWLEEAKKVSAQAQQSESIRAELSGQTSRLIAENKQVAAQLKGLQTELERSLTETESLAHEKQNQQSAFAKEKLDLLGQLDKTRHALAGAEADRTRMSASIVKYTEDLARLQTELEHLRTVRESLASELQGATDENRRLAARVDAQASALDGAVKSLEAARTRIRELQVRLSEIDEHLLVRVLKACRLWPW